MPQFMGKGKTISFVFSPVSVHDNGPFVAFEQQQAVKVGVVGKVTKLKPDLLALGNLFEELCRDVRNALGRQHPFCFGRWIIHLHQINRR